MATGVHGTPVGVEEDPRSSLTRELVSGPEDHRNWRGIFIAILVIAVVLLLIVAAILIVSPAYPEPPRKELFSYEDMVNPQFQPKKFHFKWVADTSQTRFVYVASDMSLIEYSVSENSSTVILTNETFVLESNLFYVSPNGRFILLPYNVQQVYRHSYLARYKIFDRAAVDPGSSLLPFPGGNGPWTEDVLQYAAWTPTGGLSFVYNNNLYYQSSPYPERPVAITSDGEDARLFHGIPDWLYEEEILNSNCAHWWSPNGATVAYATFDDRQVPFYRFPFYGPGEDVYGNIRRVAYPKAGGADGNNNPRVLLRLASPDVSITHKSLTPPAELGDCLCQLKPGVIKMKLEQRRQAMPQLHRSDQEFYWLLSDVYLLQVAWQSEDKLLVTWGNRPQNKSALCVCDVHSAECVVNQLETIHEGRGWVSATELIFLENEGYIAIFPEQDSHYGFWKHLAMVSTPRSGVGTRIYLTQGTWDVTGLSAYDPDTQYVYFISTNGDPRKRHLYRIRVIENDLLRQYSPECLSCDVSADCQYVSASFSRGSKDYILHCKGPGVPMDILLSTYNDRRIMLEDNEALAILLADRQLPRKEYIEVPIDRDTTLWGQMILPPKLNTAHITQYPTLVYTYGGPGSQVVTDEFHLGWPEYMACQKGVIYVSLDGRGSGGRGERWMHAIHKRLGTVEIQDQLEGAKYIRENFAYVDGTRMAIWGWSYGGFVTLHALADDRDNVFGCGVAVAPVTDWRYYDTAYTERYMGLERDNYKGYDNANVSWKADRFVDKELLIIHGTADDNVHFQHSAQFIKALTEAGADFRTQLYIDKNHAISGDKTTRHMRKTMANFLIDSCWGGGEPRVPAEDSSNTS